MNAITSHHDDDDDGFSGSLTSGRLIKGQLIRWNETKEWVDRDGLRPPQILLALALSEAVQRWKEKKVIEEITTNPLPDVKMLNATVPQSEWEPGLDGKPRPPYVHQVIVYLIDPASGAFFTYLNSTIGVRIAYEQLRERVITMRALRGSRVNPMVKLSHRPMKTFVGMKRRPEFEIIGWKKLGGDGGSNLPGPQAPQLTGPTSTAAPAPKPEEPKPEPTSTSDPKPKVQSAADATLIALEEVSEPTMSEIMKDSVPW
jgi:hypothetical protein